MKSVHINGAKYLQLEVNTTTLNPNTWGKVSTAGGLYYHIESQYLTHEVSTHSWGHVSNPKGQYNMKSVHITEAKFLLLEVSTTTLSWIIWHMKSVHINEAKFLQLEVNTTTTLSPSTLGQVSTARS